MNVRSFRRERLDGQLCRSSLKTQSPYAYPNYGGPFPEISCYIISEIGVNKKTS